MRTREIGRRLPAELASVLERDIRERKFAPGEKLPTESELAEQFAVSRSAVREAIAYLRSAGLVHTRQGAGTFAADAKSPRSAFSLAGTKVNKAELCYVFEIREEVETGAAALAARYRSAGNLDAMRAALHKLNDAVEHGQPAAQHDIEFHHAIAAASGNRFFHELLDMFAEQIVESIVIARSNTARKGSLTQSVQLEHQSIFDAIEEGNPEAARAAMHVHLSNAKKRLGLRRPAESFHTEVAE